MGRIVGAKVGDIPLEQAPSNVQTNLLSALYLIQPALPYLRRSGGETGKIVLVSYGSSVSGLSGLGIVLDGESRDEFPRPDSRGGGEGQRGGHMGYPAWDG